MVKKEIIHAPTKCGGILEVSYSGDNSPYLKCDSCGHVVNDWVKWDSTYSKLWEDSKNWNDKKDHLTVLLGYFCHVYKKHYDIPYTLSLNEKGLFRGPEINVLRRVYSMLGKDPFVVKDYIDFIFHRKVQKRKKKLTSLSYLAVGDFIREFKLAEKKAEMVNRSTVLPKRLIEWVNKFASEILNHVSLNDYGDLNLLLTHYSNGHFTNNSDINKFVMKLIDMKYIDTSFKIKNWSEE